MNKRKRKILPKDGEQPESGVFLINQAHRPTFRQDDDEGLECFNIPEFDPVCLSNGKRRGVEFYSMSLKSEMKEGIFYQTLDRSGFNFPISLANITDMFFEKEVVIHNLSWIFTRKILGEGVSTAITGIKSRFDARRTSNKELQILVSMQTDRGQEFIVKVREIWMSAGEVSLCLMDPGMISLQERIGRGEVRKEDVKPILRQLLSGLSYMHEKGVLHLDINEENVVMFRDMRYKYVNFSNSETLPVNENAFYTETPKISRYKDLTNFNEEVMMRFRRSYTTKTDIFALAMIFVRVAIGPTALTLCDRNIDRYLTHFPGLCADLHMLINDKYSAEFRHKLVDFFGKDGTEFMEIMLNNNREMRYSADVLLQHRFISGSQEISRSD